MLKTEGKMN